MESRIWYVKFSIRLVLALSVLSLIANTTPRPKLLLVASIAETPFLKTVESARLACWGLVLACLR